MLIKKIDDTGIIKLTGEELEQYRGCKIGLVKINSNLGILTQLQELFAGEAEKAGFKTEQELLDYMLEIRKEIRGY